MPESINASGTITGYYTTQSRSYPFLRAPDGTITKLNGLGGSSFKSSAAYGINASGAITGTITAESDTTVVGFIFNPD